MSPLPGIDQSPDPRSNSGVHPIIGDKTGVQLGVVVTLVGLAVALTGAIVRGESSASWAKERIESLEKNQDKDREKAAEVPLLKAEVAGLRVELASFRSEMKESMRELQRGVRSARDGR